MGLFGKIKQAVSGGTPAPKKPKLEPLDVQNNPHALLAPVSGRLMDITAVPDPVFSSKTLGSGCGIYPENETIYAPCDATISMLADGSKHALGLTSTSGIEVLIHVGIDTVEMGGKGFEYLVEKGSKVAAGTPVMSFSRAAIAEAGYEDVVIMVVTNSDDYATIELAPDANTSLRAGEPALRVE